MTLKPPHFAIDFSELEAAMSEKTKMIIFNTPHNPSGHVASEEEISRLAELCIRHDVIALSDEVRSIDFLQPPRLGS